MLERLARHEYYYFLDGYSGYNQIPIALEDQDKTTFTCPFGAFAYEECTSAYAMLLQHSNVACLVSSLTWWKDF